MAATLGENFVLPVTVPYGSVRRPRGIRVFGCLSSTHADSELHIVGMSLRHFQSQAHELDFPEDEQHD